MKTREKTSLVFVTGGSLTGTRATGLGLSASADFGQHLLAIVLKGEVGKKKQTGKPALVG